MLAPAIRYAREGFPVTEVIAGYWNRSVPTALRNIRASRELYHARRPRAARTARSSRTRISRDTLRDDRERRPRRLLQGRDRRDDRRLLRQANGGLSRYEDFAEHTSEWVEPVATTYRGYDVWELPPHGPGDRRAPDAQPARSLRPQKMRLGSRRATAPASSRRRSSPTRTARSSTPTRRSPRCRSQQLDLEGVRRRAPQADRPDHALDERRRPATRSSAGDTIYLTSSTRTATASR